MAPVLELSHGKSDDADATTNGSIKSGLNASKIKVSMTATPKVVPDLESDLVKSHRACTDHMVVASWTEKQGWADPELVPYGPLPLLPSASVLQYATSCYEGMKVFRGIDGKLRLFRPKRNCLRMVASAARISLPTFDPEELLGLIKKLCAVEAPKWLPKENTCSFLYIRPTLMGSDSSLGFEVPKAALLVIFMTFWPAYKINPTLTHIGSEKPNTGSGLRLLASRENEVRAWPGGTGAAKVSANYGPALLAHGYSKSKGFDQVLWLFGEDCKITEAGSTNLFVIWKKGGKLYLVTPPLDEGLILPGVTRQSILDLSRDRFKKVEKNMDQEAEPLEVVEISFTIFDVIAAADKGRLKAVFAVGTAFFVNPVSHIHFRGRDINIDVDSVPHPSMLRNWLNDAMFGKESSQWVEEVGED